jgi:Ca-activated chloride channel family protein
MKKILLVLIAMQLICCTNLFGYDFYRIRNVDYPWYWQDGTIEQSVISVKPKGQYVECGLYLDFSTHGTTYSEGDSLEIYMRFSMPENIEITDLWLWVGDDIMRGIVMDKWTASDIYNGIVNLRQDPALLLKVGANEYDLRIFPLMTDLPRRIKLTYLVPIEDYVNSLSSVTMPLNILKLSKYEKENFHILYWPDLSMNTPSIVEDIDYEIYPLHDPDKGDYFQIDVPNVKSLGTLNMSLTNEFSNSNFIGKYKKENDDDGYYQMKVIPNQLFDITPSPKKSLFVFDFIESNTSGLSPDEIINGLKNSLLSNFNELDKFNIMFSGMMTNTISDNWISGDSISIENAFNQISSDLFNNYSNLPTILIDGINFIKENDNEGTIVLVSSSNSHGDYEQANALIYDFLGALNNKDIPIHIVDLDNKYYSYSEMNYIGGIYYKGNEYFYLNLSRQTVGEYMSLRENSYNNMLANTISKLSDYLTSFDIYTTLESGYTFANYNLTKENGFFYLDQPYTQVGKYIGETPFKVIASGQLSTGEFLHNETTINNSETLELDSITKTIWYGKYLSELLSQEQTNSVINEVIQTSIEERILTDYTAYLCLEPDEDIHPYDGEDEVDYLDIDSLLVKDSVDFELANYPNPFNAATTIKYKLNKQSDVKLVVYDVKGREVTVLADDTKKTGIHKAVFDGQSVSSGVYFYHLTIDGKAVLRKKMMLIK